MQQIYLESYIKGFRRLQNYAIQSEDPKLIKIEHRIKIILFFEKYGAQATRDGFGVSRSTVFLWKKKLKEGGGSLTALAPKSKAPKRKRKRETPSALVEFIRDYRNAHPKIGKEALKPIVDVYCEIHGLRPISCSTIGRILSDLKKRGQIHVHRLRLSFYAKTGKLRERKRSYRKKLRLPRGYKAENPGDLAQIDSVHRFVCGLKRYIVSAVDLKTRMAFSQAYSSLSSSSTKDFMEKCQVAFPFPIKGVQTDNGSEFFDHFERYVSQNHIPHFHIYPKHPQSNAYIERFNRTLQEQFVDWHEEELEDVDTFNKRLIDYLLWYNAERPHKSLKYLPPLKYYVDTLDEKHQSNMLWTSTNACVFY